MSWAAVGKSKINVIEIDYNIHKFLIKIPIIIKVITGIYTIK